MTLTDVLSVEEWESLVRDIQDKYGLDCSVSDPDAGHVTHAGKWCNKLCPEIKKLPGGLGKHMRRTAQSFTAQARQTAQAVVSECDAGMAKISVPIYSGDEFLEPSADAAFCTRKEKWRFFGSKNNRTLRRRGGGVDSKHSHHA